ncbi:cytochrome c3 family protein [Desulfovibrio inopinatus]|uniref:cytochrome c3 family protein n=1 Tax=Desulfovibrio inopinatus TaxID=102109 RepID=UPI000410A32A|nr:NapC/NirT family cytochrome c [Desulfovibrio inopinatus]
MTSPKNILLPLVCIVVGMVLAFPVFMIAMSAMVSTSTPEFCRSCHEIEPAVDNWRLSTHVNNAQGLSASCMDCHLPPPEKTLTFFVAKTYHGIKDYWGHLTEGADGYDRLAAKQAVYEHFDNTTCLKCHQNILYIPNRRGAMLAHRAVLYARPGNEKKCTDCHRDLVHEPRHLFNYKQFDLPYQANGLPNL